MFWSSHAPMVRPYSQQYASRIFYHSEEQRELALQTRRQQEGKLGTELFTEILPFASFTMAEDYHQKYRLQQVPKVQAELNAIFPHFDDLVDSTLAARINGYIGGDGTIAEIEREIDALGLSPEAEGRLLALLEKRR